MKPAWSWTSQLTASMRVSAFMYLVLALVAVVLVAIGCVSLFHSMVKDSVREIGIRMALGARHVAVAGRIVAQGGSLAVVGILIGLACALVVARRIEEQLYRTDAVDAVTFITVPLLILGIGLLSVSWPALQATGTDPDACLRSE